MNTDNLTLNQVIKILFGKIKLFFLKKENKILKIISPPLTLKSSKEMKVYVYEMVENETLEEMFGSLSLSNGNNLDKLCLTQHQITEFCETHRDWLRKNNYATLFLTKKHNEFFIVIVRVRTDGLDVYSRRFGYYYVWDANHAHRLVSPVTEVLAP